MQKNTEKYCMIYIPILFFKKRVFIFCIHCGFNNKFIKPWGLGLNFKNTKKIIYLIFIQIIMNLQVRYIFCIKRNKKKWFYNG